jgi:UMP-CMP kinase
LEVTIKFVENAMRAALQSKSGAGWVDGTSKGRFLIDGFPRKMDQALKFEEDVLSQPSRLPFLN